MHFKQKKKSVFTNGGNLFYAQTHKTKIQQLKIMIILTNPVFLTHLLPCSTFSALIKDLKVVWVSRFRSLPLHLFPDPACS